PVVARLVVVGLDDSATQKLTDLLGTRRALGRRVFVSRHPMDLAFDPQRHAHYLNLTTADPDPNQHWWDQPAERLPLPAQPPAAPPVVNLATAAETGKTARPTALPDAATDADTAPTEPDRAL
ncbi:hypothetical protein G3M53_29150, partial [Streptomyces sp. SID7982]|nr:hypothetical protein [Streptomyces sp. SID7982]